MVPPFLCSFEIYLVRFTSKIWWLFLFFFFWLLFFFFKCVLNNYCEQFTLRLQTCITYTYVISRFCLKKKESEIKKKEVKTMRNVDNRVIDASFDSYLLRPIQEDGFTKAPVDAKTKTKTKTRGFIFFKNFCFIRVISTCYVWFIAVKHRTPLCRFKPLGSCIYAKIMFNTTASF